MDYFRIEDGIIIFEFKGNKVCSISNATLRALDEAIDKADNEEDIKGIILTGIGRYFSGGFDLREFTTFSGPDAIVDWFKFEEALLLKLFRCKKPVIAAINGHATAAGMIVAMACDYRIAIDNPKTRIGMTEIKIGLALTPAEAGLMRWGLDTEKNYRDVIFKGELISVNESVDRGIFDELVADEAALIAASKAKVCALIDTPGRPFIGLKLMHRMNAAEIIEKQIGEYDWQTLVATFGDPTVQATLVAVRDTLGI